MVWCVKRISTHNANGKQKEKICLWAGVFGGNLWLPVFVQGRAAGLDEPLRIEEELQWPPQQA